MSQEACFITDVNPNDTCGGGGCVCSPVKVSDCFPPYAVFPGNDMENPLSPHVVICMKCLEAATGKAALEVLHAGEVDGTVVEVNDESEIVPEV